MEEKISIIVPIYNVELYLEKCLNSIINQTYTNIEIILVNDGSQDRCGEICEQYAQKDSRIKVIHKENGGLSDARNRGIEFATGKYIGFVDSDDYIASDMYEYLYKLIKEENADVSICDFYIDCGNEIINHNKIFDKNKIVFSSANAIKSLLKGTEIQNYAWNKLYRIELFDKIKYPFGKKMEDLGTTYLIFDNAENIVVGSEKKYYYLQRSDSIVNTKCYDLEVDKFELALKRYKYIKERYPNICENYIYFLKIILSIYRAKIPGIEEYIEKSNIINEYNEILKYKKIYWKKVDIKTKIKCFIFNLNKKIYKKI